MPLLPARRRRERRPDLAERDHAVVAIPTDAINNVPSVKYQEISRMIYQAKATGATISVRTSGGIVPACSNFVDVEYVSIQ